MADDHSTTDRPRKRPWLRRVGVVVGCLLAGAIINVLVAWRLVASAEFRLTVTDGSFGIDTNVQPQAFWVLTNRESLVGLEIVQLEVFNTSYVGMRPVNTNRLPSWSAGHTSPTGLGRGTTVNEFGIGWPFLAILRQDLGGAGRHTATVYPELGLSDQFATRPLWPGFLANSLIFALAAFGVFMVTQSLVRFATRRLIWGQQGLCPSCGYDLRGADHGKCPECGEAMTVQ